MPGTQAFARAVVSSVGRSVPSSGGPKKRQPLVFCADMEGGSAGLLAV